MNKQRNQPRVWSWQVTGAVCSFCGGIVAALIGSVLTAMSWFLGAQLHPWLRDAGTALLIATIPLLIFSGYCLDWSEREEVRWKQIRTTEVHIKERNINDLDRD